MWLPLLLPCFSQAGPLYFEGNKTNVKVCIQMYSTSAPTQGPPIAITDPSLVASQKLCPRLPFWTFVPVLKGGFLRSPAAVLVVVPETPQAYAFLQVCHPVGRDVNQTCYRPYIRKPGV